MPWRTMWRSLLTAFGLGVISLWCQIAILRELGRVVNPNELFLGFGLAAWLAGTGLGVGWVYRELRARDWSANTLQNLSADLAAVVPLLSLLLIRSARIWTGLMPGQEPGIGATLLIIAITVLFTAMTFGVWYSALLEETARESAETDPSTLAAWLFGAEALGGFAAGLAYSLVLARAWDPWTVVLISGFAALIYAGFRYHRWTGLAVLGLTGVLLLQPGPWLDRSTEPWTGFPGTSLYSAYTPKGHVALLSDRGLNTVYLSGKKLYSFPLPDVTQPPLALGLALAPRAKVVGIFDPSPETLAFLTQQPRIERIHIWVEDAEAQARLVTHLPSPWQEVYQNPKLIWETQDFRVPVTDASQYLDLIVIAKPLPATLPANRFFTDQFIHQARQRLSNEGLLEYALPFSPNRQNPAELATLASIWTPLRSAFAHANTALLAGDRLYFVAANRFRLEAWVPEDLGPALTQAGLVGVNFLPEQFARLFDLNRSQGLQRALDQQVGILNSDENPRATGFGSWWLLSQQALPALILVLALLAVVLWYLGRALLFHQNDSRLFLVSAGAFAAMTVELTVILVFQNLRGDLWQSLGLIFRPSCWGRLWPPG